MAEKSPPMKPVADLTPLGRHMREYRKANRYSIDQICKEIGMSKAQWWQLETCGDANPRLKSLVAIAKGTRTTLARVATLAATKEPTK